ncbi:MAG: FAD-dependent thymidylate synthase [Candidatus Glassbacteria bacterium]|nr:FAD-dependent thymidylate synthase [Candidatus Glassbacteria bacterium]
MARLTSPEAEKLLDQEIRVLDKGFVRLVDYLGGDARIVQSARVSYGEGTTTVRRDKALIDYLMRHLHTSPFEQVIITIHAKLPIFVARQWIRHRTARLNEYSGRYSEMTDEFYIPAPERIHRQDTFNVQASSDEEVPPELQAKVISLIENDCGNVYANYRAMLDDGVSRELARINLPLTLYTEWYWQIDLHNLFHFLKLRMDQHAQWEIRQYANVLGDIARAVAPWAYESFEEHILHGANFSRSEIEALKAMINGRPCPLEGRLRTEFMIKMELEDEQH